MTGNTLLLFNQWFDVMNSRIPVVSKNPLKGEFGLHIEEHLTILDGMLDFMNFMQLDDSTLSTSTVDDRNSNKYAKTCGANKKEKGQTALATWNNCFNPLDKGPLLLP
ncbi:unnamed protein product [Lepeophtheirus salmonis]|uniref:(salmon louse) hypothetical protein n=1 Tax=Lepeophtheirus salmonis TaxID=72036 RepID=A0A7R8H129_LEPSM|nr:unnamed protein product [Lepeophtheirus salmonis]CAF2780709.1 unnamed protein product [Lepeophtheirus salmonis]